MKLCGLSRNVFTTRNRNGEVGHNCGVLLKKIAAMFKFSLSALAHIGRQDGHWELLLKYDRDDVHNFKTYRLSFLGCGTNGV